MAKRFIDTELFHDSWFMNLCPNYKLFYIYLITNCDFAGIIDLNIRLAEFLTGIEGLGNSLERVWKEFGEKRVIYLTGNYYFLPKFIKYQYPNGLSESVKAQKSVMERLQSFNLYDKQKQTVNEQLGNSLITVQDKDIYKDKDNLKGGMGENLELINEIMDYYEFTEMRNPDKLRQIFQFSKILEYDNKLELFKEQFRAYKKYKEESKEIRHAFSNFLGSIENRYLDGGWNARNWTAEKATNNNSVLMKPKGILKQTQNV
jgi:hypothetical protein